jgi:photosystem II stability/assembly factor-like uncharacterized protein
VSGWRKRTARAIACAWLASLVSFAPRAHANGRFPAANQIVVAPSDPALLVLRTTFGVLLSHDRGKTWDWICEKAVGNSSQEDPSLGITATSTILAGEIGGLALSADTGCAWSVAPGDVGKKAIVDVVVRRDAPHTALALGTKFRAATDAGDATYDSQVYVTTDDGATWSALGAPLDPLAVLETLEVAASDPHRLYVSARIGPSSAPRGVLYVSTDDGSTWTLRDVPLDAATERAPFISAVDPNNADRLYVRTSGTNVSRLLVSDDAGQSFRVAYAGSLLFGFALSPDGATVYLGGPKDGLWSASSADLAFTQRSKASVQCLATSGATLYVCSNEASGFVVGASGDDGKTIAPLLHLGSIRGALACAPGTTAAVCAADWPALRDTLGSDTGGVDAGTPPAPAASRACGCDDVGRRPGGTATAAALLAALAATLYARSRARTRARSQRAPRAPRRG